MDHKRSAVPRPFTSRPVAMAGENKWLPAILTEYSPEKNG